MPSSWVISKKNIPIDYPKQWFSTGGNFVPYPQQGIFGKSLETFLVVSLWAAVAAGGGSGWGDSTGV